MADADHDAVGQLAAQRLVQRELLTFVERRRRFVEEDHLRLGQQDACERDPLLLAGREHLRPVGHLVEPAAEMPQRHGVEGGADLLVGESAFPTGIGHHRAQIAERHVGKLGHEHGVVVLRPAQGSRRERPELRQAAQQCRLSGAGPTGDHQGLAGVQPHVERVDQPCPCRCPDFDVGQLERAVTARLGGQ